jgi:ATP-binding cassette subfamily B protein
VFGARQDAHGPTRDPFPPVQGTRKDLSTLRTLLPYLWPAGSPDLRLRVVIAILFLIAAKGVNVTVPMFYKKAVDALSADVAAAVAVPVALIVAYGLARVLAQAFGELRDAVFARVEQRAVRQAALQTFEHLHRLSLRFHLDRKTGGISRAIERGVRGIEFLLDFMLFNILPTLFEILLVCGILWSLYSFWFALVTFFTIACYIAWTLVITDWRIKYRQQMNETDSPGPYPRHRLAAQLRDGKIFRQRNPRGAPLRFGPGRLRGGVGEERDDPLAAQHRTGRHHRHRTGRRDGHGRPRHDRGHHDHRDFVLVNTYLIQLYMPLNFLASSTARSNAR